MNWVQVNKNYIAINDAKEIIYNSPREDDVNSIHSDNKDERVKAIGKYTGKIKSSEYFENGYIEFDVKFDNDNLAFLNVVIGDYIFAINSGIAKKAYCIRVGDITLDKSAELGTVIVNKYFKVKISVEGSNLQFIINDVVVCKTNGVISRSQIILGIRSTDKVVVKNFKINSVRPKAFVVMQFTEEYNQLYSDVIKPVCEDFGYDCKRGDEYFTGGFILKDIIDAINDSSVIIADITPNNPNVFYEVGYAHALNKPTILLSDRKRDKLPFDVSGFRTLFYDNTIGGKSVVEELLRKHLENIKANN